MANITTVYVSIRVSNFPTQSTHWGTGLENLLVLTNSEQIQVLSALKMAATLVVKIIDPSPGPRQYIEMY